MGVPKYANGFKFTLHEDTLDIPLKWKRPRKIFVDSMSDLFHERMPDWFLDKVFLTMKLANWHVFQILTKRPKRMSEYCWRHQERTGESFPRNIWLGTSVELPMYLDRLNWLRDTPARIRFISHEPLLGRIGDASYSGIGWVIVGGESGPNHRPMDLDWAREIRDNCVRHKIPFFFKQHGGRTPKSGGRLLDGLTWDEFPA